MLEILNLLIRLIFILIFILVSIAFFTLLERKVLSNIQIRKGPLYTGYVGLLQPFFDAIKLLNKQNIITLNINKFYFLISPLIRLIFSLFIWFSNPNFNSIININFRFFFFFLIRGLAVIPILVIGWSSNCKYSILGSLRSVSQIVSYEAVITILILNLVWINSSIRFKVIISIRIIRLTFYGPFFIVWLCVILSETNRTPYDFSEGGSELVSGFITEYGSFGFTIVFIREYISILFIRLLFTLILCGNNIYIIGLYIILVGFVFVWVRASLPRFRYDKLISLVWKRFLPLSIILYLYIYNLDIVKILLIT